jgi:hypothetical protein
MGNRFGDISIDKTILTYISILVCISGRLSLSVVLSVAKIFPMSSLAERRSVVQGASTKTYRLCYELNYD